MISWIIQSVGKIFTTTSRDYKIFTRPSGKRQWCSAQEEAFVAVKKEHCKPALLAHYNPNAPRKIWSVSIFVCINNERISHKP